MSKKNNLLLIGSNGFLGKNLVNSFYKKGYEKNFNLFEISGKSDLDITDKNKFKNFISSNKFKQKFIVTATPQLEIERIVDYLKIKKYIKHIYGSPKTKIENLKKINFKFSINYNQSLFIGDSLNDYLAARKLNIKFALRLNSENKFIRNINTYKFNNFLDFNINDFIKYHK